MDRNQVIGFILLFVVVIGWSIFTTPSPAELARKKAYEDSIAASQVVEQNPTTPITINENSTTSQLDPYAGMPDSLKALALTPQFGVFASAASGDNQQYVLENEDVQLTFSSRGGFISNAVMKKHVVTIDPITGRDTTEMPLTFLSDPQDRFELILPVSGTTNGHISTQDLYFSGSQSGNKLTLTAPTTSGGAIIYQYTLAESGHHLDYGITLKNVGSALNINNGSIPLRWTNHLQKLERNVEFEKRYSTVYFKEAKDSERDYCNCMKDATEDLTGKPIQWLSHSNQFFNAALMATDRPFTEGMFVTDMQDKGAPDLKIITSTIGLPYDGNNHTFDMDMYIGPNKYRNLAAYDNELEHIIPFGNSIFGSINRYIIRPAFEWLASMITSKGIVIIILILIIKVLLYPLMYKMLSSQAKMSALKPELEKIKEKFKDEPQKLQVEQMKIYQSFGVSPFGGCLPMIIQMPIWYALFRFFPASITFRQEPFLWSVDLSSFDVFFLLGFEFAFGLGSHISLFTLLWAVSMVAYTYFSTKHVDMTANPAMKYVQYIMPLLFLGYFNNYASGLTCYMLFSNLFNIAQTVGTKKFLFDEEKILAELKAKKATRPKKQGGFQARLEKMLEEQRKMQEQGKKKK